MSDKRLGVLTGAAGHIGRATVEKFASNGWSLVITDMSDAVFSVADAARKHGVAVVGVERTSLKKVMLPAWPRRSTQANFP